MPRLVKGLIGALLAGISIIHAFAAETVVCHLNYGGEARIIEATPTASPYTVEADKIGSYTLFRIVFRTEPADLASIKIYTYAQHDDDRPLIHQATYVYPPVHDRSYGFTGLNHVYEPRYGLVLEYWCELQKAISQ
jgi:hypothetical protein